VVVIISGCNYRPKDLNYVIGNGASDTINVIVYSYDKGNSSLIQIGPDNKEIIYIRSGSERKDNWYYDYNILINSITNSTGDTLRFDPNESFRWYMENSSYHLSISNGSF
jgi:hypothetical protein